jgi:hypothetical protein
MAPALRPTEMLWKLTRRQARAEPVRCNFCRAQVAMANGGALRPSADELYGSGAVSVKRLGWFCSRRCLTLYETRFRVILEPDAQETAQPSA